MTLSQFTCPHCYSPFQVDTSFPSPQVACPHCRQPVAIFSEPPVAGPPPATPPAVEPPPVDFAVAELPTPLPRGDLPSDLPLPGFTVSPEEEMPIQAAEPESISNDYRSRQIATDERASRKFVKNMIVWVGCAIVLALILAFFLAKGGS